MSTLNRRQIGQTELRVPCLGFGAAAFGWIFQPVDTSVAQSTLTAAMAAGLDYVDIAPYYGSGRSERIVGDILRGQDYILSTKVGRLLRPGSNEVPAAKGQSVKFPFTPEYDFSYDGIMRSYEDSLQRLGVNFANLCRDALKMGDWDVFLLAGRYTLLEQAPLDDLLPECAAARTSIVLGGPFNSGILVGGDTWNYGAAPQNVIERVTALKQVCAQFDVPLPAAALQFPLAHPVVASVIPGLRSLDELSATLEWVQTEIPADFWAALKQRGLLPADAPVPDTTPYIAGPQ